MGHRCRLGDGARSLTNSLRAATEPCRAASAPRFPSAELCRIDANSVSIGRCACSPLGGRSKPDGMAARRLLRACAWALGAVVTLTAAACSPVAEQAVRRADLDSTTAPEPVADRLELCEDVAEHEPSVMGNLEGVLDQVRDPDPRYRAIIRRYGLGHAPSSGGQWIDPDRGNVIVTAFTDDAEAHRAAIAALVPSSVKFDVVQVEFPEGELLAAHRRLGGFMGPEFGLTGVGLGTKRNRVTLHFTDPPPGSLAELAKLVPTHMVCAEIYRSPEPPSGPLAVIPDLAVDDPMVVCGRFGPMPYSRFLDPPRLDEVDHPAAERLREALDSPPGRLLPAGDYRVMDIGSDVVGFAAFSDEGIRDVTVVYGAGRWRIGAWSNHACSCDTRVVLPPGLGHVEVHLDPGLGPNSLPQPDDTSVDLLVREIDCANGRKMGDALQGPQVIETDDEVLVAFAVIPVSGGANCQGNPSTRVTIELSQPLGNRALLDGTYLPPRAITLQDDRHAQVAHEPTRAAPAESSPAVANSANDTLLACEDVPELQSTVEGNLSGTQNPDDELMRIIRNYGAQHESFADLWIDRAHGGALVAAFTGDLEAHRTALAALLPDGTRFDVVQADYSTADLEAVRAMIQANAHELKGMSQFGIGTTRNRVEAGFIDAPEATLERLAALVPAALVCVDLHYSPEPPSGPLDIIPLVNANDPLVECRGIGTVRYSRLVDPLSVDEVDHPAVEVLRAEIEAPSPEPLPAGDWSVMRIDDDRATFAIIEGNVIAGRASFRLVGDRWVLSGYGSAGRPCESRVPLPPGLGHVRVHLDPNTLPRSASTSIFLLVNEIGCSNGREMGNALQGPQVIETDEAVLVAFAVIPVTGAATCPGSPSTAVTVKLSRPLGERALLNGALMPPAPIESHPDRSLP